MNPIKCWTVTVMDADDHPIGARNVWESSDEAACHWTLDHIRSTWTDAQKADVHAVVCQETALVIEAQGLEVPLPPKCPKCGSDKVEGPFHTACLHCEPFWGENCLKCRRPRIECCC